MCMAFQAASGKEANAEMVGLLLTYVIIGGALDCACASQRSGDLSSSLQARCSGVLS